MTSPCLAVQSLFLLHQDARLRPRTYCQVLPTRACRGRTKRSISNSGLQLCRCIRSASDFAMAFSFWLGSQRHEAIDQFDDGLERSDDLFESDLRVGRDDDFSAPRIPPFFVELLYGFDRQTQLANDLALAFAFIEKIERPPGHLSCITR